MRGVVVVGGGGGGGGGSCGGPIQCKGMGGEKASGESNSCPAFLHTLMTHGRNFQADELLFFGVGRNY